MDTFPLAALLNGNYVLSDAALPAVYPAFIPVRTFQRPTKDQLQVFLQSPLGLTARHQQPVPHLLPNYSDTFQICGQLALHHVILRGHHPLLQSLGQP